MQIQIILVFHFSVTAFMLSCLSHVRLFATLWTVACLAPLSRGFSRQEYWSGLPLPPPGDLPNLKIEPASLMSPALAGGFFTTSAIIIYYVAKNQKLSQHTLLVTGLKKGGGAFIHFWWNETMIKYTCRGKFGSI